MQLARTLKLIGLDVFPCRLWFDNVKRKYVKAPRTLNHESWRDTAARDFDACVALWSETRVLGIVIPEDVIIIDIDSYQGICSTEILNGIFGELIPWSDALIQTTISGGAHYAFRAPRGWRVKQGDSHHGLKGFDTRVAGKGFICAGEGYTPAGALGVMRLASPASLPVLPESCRAWLEEPVIEQIPRVESPSANDSEVVIIDALRHIDPATRDVWLRCGYALKDVGLDDEHAFALWDAWSRGDYSAYGCPAGYNADTQYAQWCSFKQARNDGGAEVRAASLYYLAMQGGWTPPLRFDTQAAFGQDACSASLFAALIDDIQVNGCNPMSTEELRARIITSNANRLQQSLLINLLEQQLKDAGLLDKTVKQELRRDLTQTSSSGLPGLYGRGDDENAELFLQRCYPDQTLLRINEIIYRYNGVCWEVMTREQLAHEIDHETRAARLQTHHLNAMVSRVLIKLSNIRHGEKVKMNCMTNEKIVFTNGVLNLATMQLEPHSPAYYTTQYKPYEYNPMASCAQWINFLLTIFDGDLARVALLQEWFGYLLVSDYRFHKMMMMVGPPRSGKGTVGKIISEVLGPESFSGGELASFAEDSFIDNICDKNAVFVGDAERKITPSLIGKVVSRLKEISGNDHVSFNRKFKAALSDTVKAKITIASNTIPMLFDDSGAFGSRMLVLVFSHSFLGRENPNLFDALRQERAGIAAWAIEGLRRLYSNNGVFTKSEVGDNEREYIEDSFNPLKRFLEETCELEKHTMTSSGDLHQAYVAWAINNGDTPLTRRPFTAAVKDNLRATSVKYGSFWSTTDNKAVRGFKGIRIKGAVQPRTEAAFQPRIINGGR